MPFYAGLFTRAHLVAIGRGLLAPLLLVALVVCAYAPGLSGSFVFDDSVNLGGNPNFILRGQSWRDWLAASFSSISGPTHRPLAMLTFVINQWFSGVDNPWPYKLTNMAMHALNACLVYGFMRLLLRLGERCQLPLPAGHQSLALTIACLFAVHPLGLTSVLYVVQRMTLLAATFSLLAVIIYLYGRERMLTSAFCRRSYWVGFALAIPGSLLMVILAVLSKESALTTLLVLPVLELTLFRWRAHFPLGDAAATRDRFYYRGGLCLIALLLTALLAAVIASSPQWLNGYVYRPYSLSERLLSQMRYVWFYVGLVVVPSSTALALYHDDLALSTGLFSPPTTAWAMLAWGLVFIALARPASWRRWPWVCLGVTWFLLGHILESTIWPLELVHEHRNYLPMLGLLWALVMTLAGLLPRSPSPLSPLPSRWLTTILPRWSWHSGLAILAIALLFTTTCFRAYEWGDEGLRSEMESLRHPDSPRSRYESGRWHLQRFTVTGNPAFYDSAIEHLRHSLSSPRPGIDNGCLAQLYAPYLRDLSYDPEQLRFCAERLRQSPAIEVNLNLLEFLSERQSAGMMKIPDQAFLTLPQALLDNPRLSAQSRSRVESLIGTYLANKMHDYQQAGLWLSKAVATNPGEFAARSTWISFLLAIGQLAAAADEIAAAEQRPDAWRIRSALIGLKERLERETAARRTLKPAAGQKSP